MRMLSSEMLEGGRPGHVFMLLGRSLGVNGALPVGGGAFGFYKGLVGDRNQLFVDLCSWRFQPSDLVESQRAVPESYRLKLLLNGAGRAALGAPERASLPGRSLGTAFELSGAELPSPPTHRWNLEQFPVKLQPWSGNPQPCKELKSILIPLEEGTAIAWGPQPHHTHCPSTLQGKSPDLPHAPA